MANARAQAGRTSAQSLAALVIAPDSGLPNAAEETQRIVNLLRPQILLGNVTASDVLDTMAGGTFDVVWFLGHSGPEGLELSDGILPPERLTQILRQSPPQLVVLNSCSSFYIANQIHDYLQCAVISTVMDVPDIEAYTTGAALAYALAEGKDITAAYEASKPPNNRKYVLINGNVMLNGRNEIDDVKRLLAQTSGEVHGEVAGMAREMAKMQRALDMLVKRVDDIGTEQQRVRTELAGQPDRYAATLTRKRALSWGSGFALFLLAHAILEFREVLDVPMWVALGFSLFVAAVSFWLFVYGIGFRLDR